MEAIRQHVLPRFLLKGFASRIRGGKVFTWVYRKQGKISEHNIKNVGFENYFYGKEGGTTVDAEITDLEQKYAEPLDGLREMEGEIESFRMAMSDFITHLTIRTKHFRDSVRESSDFLIDRMHEYLSDFDNLKRLSLRDTEGLKRDIEKTLTDSSVPKPYRELILPLVPFLVASAFDEHKSEMQMMLHLLIAKLKIKLPTILKESHIKSLKNRLVPELRAESYRALRWFAIKCSEPLILGDTGCFFETVGQRRFKPIDDKGDEIKNIFLPISSDRILVGTSLSLIPQIDVGLINDAVAKCSREFFVCSQNREDKCRLRSSIGEDAAIITEKELKELVEEAIREDRM